MNSVLRRKIDLGSGVPPGILRAANFWRCMTCAVAAWVEQTHAVKSQVDVIDQAILTGKQTEEKLNSPFCFVFQPNPESGFCGAKVAKFLAAQYASERMRQSLEHLDSASDLFLKMLYEEPMGRLYVFLEGCLTQSEFEDRDTAPSFREPKAGLLDIEKILQVELRIEWEGREVQITLWFEYNAIKRATDSSKESFLPENPHAREILSEQLRQSRLRFDAVLDEIHLTIGEVSKLSVGQILRLPSSNTESLNIVVDTMQGGIEVSTGELGVWKQFRAVKLNKPLDAQFKNHVERM